MGPPGEKYPESRGARMRNSQGRSSGPSRSLQVRPKGPQGSSKRAHESGSIGGRPQSGRKTTPKGFKITQKCLRQFQKGLGSQNPLISSGHLQDFGVAASSFLRPPKTAQKSPQDRSESAQGTPRTAPKRPQTQWKTHFGTKPGKYGIVPGKSGTVPEKSGNIPETFGSIPGKIGIVPNAFGFVPSLTFHCVFTHAAKAEGHLVLYRKRLVLYREILV